MDSDAYVGFLLEHHAELDLPYSFAMSLSFISSQLILGKAVIVISEEQYEIVGAAGLVYGTGENQYEDKHICQLEIAYIQQNYLRTPLFVHGLLVLVNAIREDNPTVTQVQFWTAADQGELNKLFTKFMLLPRSTRTIVNQLALYSIPYEELAAYCGRLTNRKNN